MKANELVDAVRQCLPLPGIIDVDYDPDIKLSFLMETEGDGWQSMPLKPYALNHIIGAIVQACVERGWGIEHHSPTCSVFVKVDGGIVAKSLGTDALAWCRAYAAALRSFQQKGDVAK